MSLFAVDQIHDDSEIWTLKSENDRWSITTDHNNNTLHTAGFNDFSREYFGSELIDFAIQDSKSLIEITTKFSQNTHDIFNALKNDYPTKTFVLIDGTANPR